MSLPRILMSLHQNSMSCHLNLMSYFFDKLVMDPIYLTGALREPFSASVKMKVKKLFRTKITDLVKNFRCRDQIVECERQKPLPTNLRPEQKRPQLMPSRPWAQKSLIGIELETSCSDVAGLSLNLGVNLTNTKGLVIYKTSCWDTDP